MNRNLKKSATRASPKSKLVKDQIFADNAPHYGSRGYAVVPVARGGKNPLVKSWADIAATNAGLETYRQKFPTANIGLIAGSVLPNNQKLAFIDIDDDRLVPFVGAIAPSSCGKVGSKGLTSFYRAVSGLKTAKLRGPGAAAPAVEIFTTTGQTVLPPSIHPSGKRYRWCGRSLLEIEPAELSPLDETAYRILVAVLKNKSAWEIVNGGPTVKAHNSMLKLTELWHCQSHK